MSFLAGSFRSGRTVTAGNCMEGNAGSVTAMVTDDVMTGVGADCWAFGPAEATAGVSGGSTRGRTVGATAIVPLAGCRANEIAPEGAGAMADVCGEDMGDEGCRTVVTDTDGRADGIRDTGALTFRLLRPVTFWALPDVGGRFCLRAWSAAEVSVTSARWPAPEPPAVPTPGRTPAYPAPSNSTMAVKTAACHLARLPKTAGGRCMFTPSS